ncbi:hypothetical protein ES703_98960 [subsurface metagenome]
MKAPKFTDDELIERIIPLAKEYRRRFGKSLGITSEVGEYKAAKLLKLKRAPGNIQRGFDAIDEKGRRVQIKSRVSHRSQERTGLFNNFDFDYALLVLMSEDYEVTEIYKAQCKRIKEQIQNQSYKRPSLSVGKFKQLAKRVYP